MSTLPSRILSAWKNHVNPVVLTTTSQDGIPNSIYASCAELYEDEVFVIADNYFHKTKENINHGGSAALLFITDEGKSYQLKGKIRLETSGPIYDFMKSWNPEKHPGHAAAVLEVLEIYSGAEKIS